MEIMVKMLLPDELVVVALAEHGRKVDIIEISIEGILFGCSSYSGAGNCGTSYSGGTGGGEAYYYAYGSGSSYAYGGLNGKIGEANGRAGGEGNNGGTGNPGGKNNGTNGTGGLLVIYTNILNNNGKITSQGTDSIGGAGASGGGSINVFYQNIAKEGEINATGGNGTSTDLVGGNGGDGCVTLTKNDKQ